eukprot:m.134092 g.134092  ORF g.134092 m.134092 type:complete len:230 (+) comp13854_c0_seq1:490-1179(+)
MSAVVAFTTPVPDLPTEVLLMIFAYLGRRGLGNAAKVCKVWRAAMITHLATAGGVWETLCNRAGMLRTENDSFTARAKKLGKLLTKVAKIRKKSPTDPRIEWAYEEHYKTCITRVCAHCGQFCRQSTEYPLYSEFRNTVSLCRVCRNLEPFACITATNAKKYFKYGTKVKKRGLVSQSVSYISTQGKMSAALLVSSFLLFSRPDRGRGADEPHSAPPACHVLGANTIHD